MVLGTFLAFSSGYAGYTMPVLLLIIVAELVIRKMRWAPTSIDRTVLALLAVSLASAVASPWRTQSLPIVALLALMFLISVYPAARVIRARPDALRLIIGVWIAGALFAAAWGIVRTPAEWPGGQKPTTSRCSNPMESRLKMSQWLRSPTSALGTGESGSPCPSDPARDNRKQCSEPCHVSDWISVVHRPTDVGVETRLARGFGPHQADDRRSRLRLTEALEVSTHRIEENENHR